MVPRLQDSHLLWYNEGEKTKENGQYTSFDVCVRLLNCKDNEVGCCLK